MNKHEGKGEWGEWLSMHGPSTMTEDVRRNMIDRLPPISEEERKAIEQQRAKTWGYGFSSSSSASTSSESLFSSDAFPLPSEAAWSISSPGQNRPAWAMTSAPSNYPSTPSVSSFTTFVSSTLGADAPAEWSSSFPSREEMKTRVGALAHFTISALQRLSAPVQREGQDSPAAKEALERMYSEIMTFLDRLHAMVRSITDVLNEGDRTFFESEIMQDAEKVFEQYRSLGLFYDPMGVLPGRLRQIYEDIAGPAAPRLDEEGRRKVYQKQAAVTKGGDTEGTTAPKPQTAESL
jgi:hypothetical protein